MGCSGKFKVGLWDAYGDEGLLGSVVKDPFEVLPLSKEGELAKPFETGFLG